LADPPVVPGTPDQEKEEGDEVSAAEMGRAQARRRRTAALLCFSLLLGLIVLSARVQPAGAEAGGALVAEPVLTGAAAGVQTLFGASPLEAPGEVWGAGVGSRDQATIVRYTEASGWEAMPPPIDIEGNPVSLGSNALLKEASAGRTTPTGGVVTIAKTNQPSEPEKPGLIIRDPGGPFRVLYPPEEFAEAGERLFEPTAPTRLAAVEEPGAFTGAFVVPVAGAALTKAVLHYNGSTWTRELICVKGVPPECKGPVTKLTVLAIDATGPGNAWLLARERSKAAETVGHIVLLRREEGQWRTQAAAFSKGPLGPLFERETKEVAPGVTVAVVPREKGQPLTVTSQGVWIDVNFTVNGETSTGTLFYNIEKGEVTGSWCDLQGPAAVMCTGPLGSELPSGEGRSFAWPGNGGEGEEFGTRAVTGVGQGALLVFEGGAFSRIPLEGNGGSSGGAALTSPTEGWLGPSYHLTRAPVPSGLASWPVPFRRPLTAIASQPEAPVGSLESQALAVGQGGQVAHYFPGVGWQPESLLSGSGAVAKPNLRGVAWPEHGVAYAVGDEGAMWLWRASIGLWEPDPGAPPNLIRGNFTGIAFQPGEPGRGYAVGKQGLLLAYGKRWTQEKLPEGISPEANITSIAFAGNEALATWTLAVPREAGVANNVVHTGGLIVNDGSGWRVEEEAPEVLEGAEGANEAVAPRRVAGLPDGGAVIAGSGGGVIEREAAGAPWHVVPGGPVGYPDAVAAIREGGQVRAIISVEANAMGVSTSSAEVGSDLGQASAEASEGQPPLLTGPYPLPNNGFLVRQTATGWRDEQRQSFPAGEREGVRGAYDVPRIPDAVLAMLISPDGGSGWVVGGNTGQFGAESGLQYKGEALQTAGVMRYGPGAAPPTNAATTSIAIPGESEAATFAVGGGAGCVGPCADREGTGIGPAVWLPAAVGKAASIPGLRAFLYTGGGIAPETEKLGRFAFGEEEAAYARRLGSAAGSLPVYAAPSSTDLLGGTLLTFSEKFAGFQQPLGSGTPRFGTYVLSNGDPAAGGAYEFESRSAANEAPVRVIVLNESSASALSGETRCWLATQLREARQVATPVIVMGNHEVGGDAELQRILVNGETSACPISEPGGASVYLYESRANREGTLASGTASIPTYGTGTLGYVNVQQPGFNEFAPTSGFLLVSVGAPNPVDNIAPVTRALIPNIGSLAIDADDGTLLRRSQVALFEALARRPVAGFECSGNSAPRECASVSPDPYAQIPARCIRGFEFASCASEILPEYRFTSSRPDVANFVKVDPASTNPRAVFLQKGKPVPDPGSGLLCAFNAGTTTITVETGGLVYSMPVTVQAGSVAQPCGTVPLSEQPALPAKPPVPPPPPPIEGSPPTFTKPSGTVPPPQPPGQPAPIPTPQPSAPPVHHPIKPPVPVQLPFFAAPTPAIAPIPVIVPPPPAPVVEPTPPSGTSPVTQPAVSPEPEEEEEAAFDLVHHMAAYRHARARNAAAVISSSPSGAPSLRYFVPALALLLALAGAGIATPRRRTSRLAYETRATPRRPHR
jgi:hypothetical protein